MSNYTVYDVITGEILRSGACPDDIVSLQAVDESEAVLTVKSNDAANYVDLSGSDPVIADRIPLPHSVDGNVISGLPVPVQVRVDGPLMDAFEVPDGEIEFAPPVPGTYTLTLTAGAMYLLAVVTLEIPDAP